MKEHDYKYNRCLMFRLGERRFCVPLVSVKEVVHKFTVEPIPGAALSIMGLINLRGHILTVVDLNMIISGNKSLVTEKSTTILIFEDGDSDFGVIVDEAIRIDRVDSQSAQQLDSALVTKSAGILCATYKIQDEIVFAIDVIKLSKSSTSKDKAA